LDRSTRLHKFSEKLIHGGKGEFQEVIASLARDGFSLCNGKASLLG